MQDLSDNDPWNPSSFLIEKMFQPKRCWRREGQPGLQPAALQGLPSLTTKKSEFRRNFFFACSSEFLWFREKHWHPRLVLPKPQQFFSQICWRLESWRFQLSPPRIEENYGNVEKNNDRLWKSVKSHRFLLISPFLVWVRCCVMLMWMTWKWTQSDVTTRPTVPVLPVFGGLAWDSFARKRPKPTRRCTALLAALKRKRSKLQTRNSTQELLTNWQT